MAIQQKEIKISEVIALLRRGYSRYRRLDQGFGSIEQHYRLTYQEARLLFRHEALKHVRTFYPTLRIIDDREQSRGTVADTRGESSPVRTEGASVSTGVSRTEETSREATGRNTLTDTRRERLEVPTNSGTISNAQEVSPENQGTILSRLRQGATPQPISEAEKAKIEEPKTAETAEKVIEDSPFD
jgi:hypothetical protein